jgi:hypothetical protein
MEKDIKRHTISIHPPKIKPKVTSIGYGNPRYNSMLVYKQSVLLTSGCHVRLMNLVENKVEYDLQVGCCQIFQLQENSKYILVINYDGLITFLDK